MAKSLKRRVWLQKKKLVNNQKAEECIKEEKDKVEAVKTRGENRCGEGTGQETRSGGSEFMPRIDNLDVKSYIRWMCLSVTY